MRINCESFSLLMRENLKEYYSMAQKHPNFDEEKIVDDILAHNFSFL